MGLLNDQLADDAAWMMGDLDAVPGAETITAGADGGAERSIVALIDRNPPATADGNMRKPAMRLTVANHATLGVDLTAFNAGKAYVKVPRVVGGSTVDTYRLTGKPTSQDAGMITFEI